jgi:hypothetical protein
MLKAYLGQLTLEGRLVRRDVGKAVRLVGPWSQWDFDTRLQLAHILADNPDVQISYPSHLVYDLTEETELGEPGALATLIALKLSRNVQFRDEEGGCKLVMEAANRGDGNASQRASECKAITTKLRGSSEVLVVQWWLYDQCENPDSREVFIEAIGESDRSSATKPPHLWPRGRRFFAP